MIVASFVVLAQSFTCVVMVSKTCPDAKENVFSKGSDVKNGSCQISRLQEYKTGNDIKTKSAYPSVTKEKSVARIKRLEAQPPSGEPVCARICLPLSEDTL